MIIDSHQNLSEPEELLRHQEVLNHPFTLVGCKVVTQGGKKLGRVKDFSTDTQHFFVNKLNVVAPFWMLPFNNRFLIDRADIVDVEKSRIVVKDAAIKATEAVTKPLPATK
jgi:ribosomal 30S subunit maturation factor RimM